MAILILVVVFRAWTQLGVATFLPFLHREELARNPAYVSALLFVFLGAGTAGTLLGGPLADRVGHRRTLFYSLALQGPLLHLFLRAEGASLFPLAALSGATIVSTFSVTIVMAQELFPKRMATVAGAVGGFAIGGGGAGVTLLGAAADRAGVEAAARAVVVLPALGALLTLLLPLPWGSRRAGAPGTGGGSIRTGGSPGRTA
jgi:FSR family fosmidomycin resistance protein-like MFS transporter